MNSITRVIRGRPPPVQRKCIGRSIVLQIVEAHAECVEAESNTRFERHRALPMIREAHAFRVGRSTIYCRKLTGDHIRRCPMRRAATFRLTR